MRVLPHHIVCLIHYVELTQAGWWEEVIDRCTLAVLWVLKEPAPMQKIRKEISKNLYVEIKARELRKALTRLERKEEIIKLHDGRYKLAMTKLQELDEYVESADTLEETVRENFCRRVRKACPKLDPINVWQSFIERFLIPLVTSEGARTYEFFIGKRVDIRFESYVDLFLEQISPSYRETLTQATYDFLVEADDDVARFLLSYLDAYFLLSASGLPFRVIKRLMAIRKEPVEFVVFVDTNFVYSILGLHDNPSNEAANDLMELVDSTSDNLHFQFVIKPSTLEETQRSLRHHKKQLGNAKYPPNVARAAASTQIYGVYKTFFERVSMAGQSISAADYFVPYEDNLIRILEEKGVTVFSGKSPSKYEQTLDIIEDIEAQKEYEDKRFKEHAKTEQQITHDIVLWHFVQDQRDRKLTLPLQAKWWIVTVDYRFLSFDRHKTRRGELLPACMHPSQLIQMLRFFVPRSDQFEKTLLAVMRLPIISREFDPAAERVSIRIVKHLARHEGIEDLQDDTLANVFADTALRTYLADANINEEEEIEAIQNTLTQQLLKQELLIEERGTEISALKKRVEKLDV